jgi:phosphatidylglycerophosphate synthase
VVREGVSLLKVADASGGEYRRSLKLPASEELIDLLLYRPAAFLLVKVLARLPVTPNQVTFLSLASGLAAAWEFSSGTQAGAVRGALFYLAANILDCADGQLARIQQSGTLMGRVLDGSADYISGFAIFAGLGLGLEAKGDASWWLVIAAGVSSSIHSIVFDHYQSDFLQARAGVQDFAAAEIGRFSREIARLRSIGEGRIRVLLLRFYLQYTRIQRLIGTFAPPCNSPRDRAFMIRLWSFLGPSTNRSLLILCALFGAVTLYCRFTALGLNAWLAGGWILQTILLAREGEPA